MMLLCRTMQCRSILPLHSPLDRERYLLQSYEKQTSRECCNCFTIHNMPHTPHKIVSDPLTPALHRTTTIPPLEHLSRLPHFTNTAHNINTTQFTLQCFYLGFTAIRLPPTPSNLAQKVDRLQPLLVQHTPPLKKAIPQSLGSLFPQKPHSERTLADSEYDVG